LGIEGIGIGRNFIDLKTVVALEIKAVQFSGQHLPLYGIGNYGRTVIGKVNLRFDEGDLPFARVDGNQATGP
jgi:hypothetical protein